MIQLGIGYDPDPSVSPPAGTGPNSFWPIYCQSEPDEPDQTITVYTTEPQLDGQSMIDGEIYQHLAFQVRVRSLSSNLAAAQAYLIEHQFSENCYYVSVPNPEATAVYTVQAIVKKGGPIPIGKELPTSERSVWVYNAIAALWRTS